MFRGFILLVVIFALVPASALASCGSDQCPIDLGMLWEQSRLSFDLSYQYIDQNQPRVGTDDAAVGAIHGGEDEVRTLSRVTTARAMYQPGGSWSFTASLPYVSRYHEHLHSHGAGTPVVQRWNYSGVGDAEVLVSKAFTRGGEGAARYHLTAGAKAPTGVRHVEEVNGHSPEPPALPGNGAWGAIAGLGAQWSLAGVGSSAVPVRLSVQGRANGRGTERYRVGSEIQSNLGVSYPVARSFEVLLSGDFRVRGKDDPGETHAEAGHTGGTWAYLSPGIRVNAAKTAFYGVVQLPVYQRVNGINLVSDFNLYMGVTRAAF